MAKITYVGSDEPGEPGRIQWGVYSFELNKPVEVTDPHIIAKAMNNKHFKVSGNGTVGKAKAEAEEAEEDTETAAEKESAVVAQGADYPPEAPDEDEDEAKEGEDKPVKRGPGRPPKAKE